MSILREAFLNKIVATVAGAAILGGGTVVLSSAQTNAVQEQTIVLLREKQERTDEAVGRLAETTAQLDKNVAVLNERLKK